MLAPFYCHWSLFISLPLFLDPSSEKKLASLVQEKGSTGLSAEDIPATSTDLGQQTDVTTESPQQQVVTPKDPLPGEFYFSNHIITAIISIMIIISIIFITVVISVIAIMVVIAIIILSLL